VAANMKLIALRTSLSFNIKINNLAIKYCEFFSARIGRKVTASQQPIWLPQNNNRCQGVERMLVKDIMNNHVKTAGPDSTISEVAIQMCFNKISGMPVVDGNNEIVGVISEKDILQGMYPGVHEFMQEVHIDFEALEAEYRDVMNLRVRDLMSTNVYTVEPDIPVLKAVSIMFLRKIRRIPVAVDNALVGIISIGDVHKAIFTKNLG